MSSVLSSRKSLTVALFALSAVLIFSTLLYSPFFRQYTVAQAPTFRPQSHRCPPQAYAAGNWTRKPDPPVMPTQDDVLAVSGFDGCASTREVNWHLGVGWQNKEEEAQKLQWRGNASAYEWLPGEGCEGYTRVTRENLVRQLVEDGGWLLLGDSITEGHFFSLSCMLYPHVRATPDYTIDPYYFDRAWPQNLYLNPTSPLMSSLTFPEGFEIDKTPLVTFRRVDLLLGKSELNDLYSRLHPQDAPKTLFSEEGTWDLDPATYLPEFVAPLPAANYRTLVISTAGHWTTTLFSAFQTDNQSSGNGLRELLEFFSHAMNLWVEKIATGLQQAGEAAAAEARPKKELQVVVRAYLHGHESCHDVSVELGGPFEKFPGLQGIWYNWNWITRFNAVFQEIVARRSHPNIHFLPIDMPGLLRPEGHVQGDCLHSLTGAGVMEGWSEYISYFVSKLP